MRKQKNARELALDTLLALEGEETPAHIRIRETLDRNRNLKEPERAFYKKLTEGVLEDEIRLDYIINLFANLKTNKMKPLIRNVLRMAVYQILEMDSVPESAAVNEAVRLVSARGYAPLRGFVNGILRNILRHPERIRYPGKEHPEDYLSIYYSVPKWLVQRWVGQYGEPITEKMCASFRKPAPLTVRIRSGNPREKLAEELSEAGISLREGAYLPDAAVLTGVTDLAHIKAFAHGAFTIQDESSQLAVRAAGIRPGDLVLDLCAAPGGKTVYAADLLGSKTGRTGDKSACAGDLPADETKQIGEKTVRAAGYAGKTPEEPSETAGGIVIARDLSRNKTDRIRENVRRCHLEDCVRIEEKDATVFDQEMEGKADIVLADLPCSGMGVIGRKPDIRYHLSEDRIRSLVTLQRTILKNAVRYLKKGGRLVYSTCTIEPAENIEQVKWIRDELHLKPGRLAGRIPDPVGEDSVAAGLPDTRGEGYLQLLPGVHRCDGFFISVFVK